MKVGRFLLSGFSEVSIMLGLPIECMDAIGVKRGVRCFSIDGTDYSGSS